MSQMKLLRDKRFYPLFWTQFLGAFNDNFLKNALVILITYKATAVLGLTSEQMVPVSGGIFIFPFFLFSATAGQIADKFEKGRIIRLIKCAEIGIMALAAPGFLLGRFDFLLGVLFLMGLHSTFFGPIKYSILPQHLEERELVGGNALVEAGTNLSILLGTIAGGVLVSLRGVGPVIVSAGLLGVAALGYLASRGIPLAPPVEPALRIQWNPIPPTFEIFRFARRNRPVFLSILGTSWFWAFGAALLSLFPHYCRNVLGAGEHVVTLFLTIFCVGCGIGSLLCERLSRKRLELGLVPFGSIGITIFTADLFFRGAPAFVAATPLGALDFIREPQGLRILIDLLMLSVFSGFYIVPLYTMIQERSAPSHRSRIIAANNILNALFMVASAIGLVGLEAMGLSIPRIFLALSALNVAVAISIYTILPEFLIRFAIWILANLLYRLRVTGDEAIPAEGPALLICNHISFIDWMIIAAGVRRPVRFVMDHGFFKGFLLKRIMTRAHVIPIAPGRENPTVLDSAYRRIADELRAGELVCIFPEGRITRDGKMNELRPGMLKIVGETPVPVVPMALNGLWGSLCSRKGGRALARLPRRLWHRIELRVGAPMRPEGITLEQARVAITSLRKEDRQALAEPLTAGNWNG